MNFDYKENGIKKVFIANWKHQCHLSQCREHDSSAQSLNNWRLLWESKFDLFHGYTLIIWNMVERKAFLPNLKHQYHVSQWYENVGVPITEKNGIIKSIQVCPISLWTLTISKMAEREAFLPKPKCQYHASQWDEHDWGASYRKNGDY